MTQFDSKGNVIARGESTNGQWNGAVQSADADGNVTKVSVFSNGVETASYIPSSDSFTGINFEGVMTTEDLTEFDKITNSLRNSGDLTLLDSPNFTKYRPLNDLLDIFQASGMGIDALENVSLDNFQDITLNPDKAEEWLNKLKGVDQSLLGANARQAVDDMLDFVNATRQAARTISALRMVGWFTIEVLAGDLTSFADYGQNLFKFAQNFVDSKILGKSASAVTADTVTNPLKKIRGTANATSKVLRFLGPVATAVGAGLSVWTGITGYQDAVANGDSDATKAYWISTATMFPFATGISAAIDASENGLSPAGVAGAFFKGLFGLYDPENPSAGLADQYWDKFNDNVKRKSSLDSLRKLNIPADPATGDPGFNGEAVYQKYRNDPGWSYHPDYYIPEFENDFYNYLKQYHPDSELYKSNNCMHRVNGYNGTYDGEEWKWNPGHFKYSKDKEPEWVPEYNMPVFGIKEGASGTNIDDLYIKEMAGPVRENIGFDDMEGLS